MIQKIEPEEGVLIIDLGQRTSVFSLFDQRGLVFNHYLRVAGNLFAQKVAEALKVSFFEAEKIKVVEGFTAEKNRKVGEVLKKEIIPVIDETKRIIQFYQKATENQIKKIILAGGSSLLPGIAQHLQKKLGLKVENRDSLTKISKQNSLPRQEKRILSANVIGLTLRTLEKDF